MIPSIDTIKDTLHNMGLLYNDELVYPTGIGCVINLDSTEYQYIGIWFKDNDNRIIIKPYSTISYKLLKHKEGKKIWNDHINKYININKLIDKI